MPSLHLQEQGSLKTPLYMSLHGRMKWSAIAWIMPTVLKPSAVPVISGPSIWMEKFIDGQPSISIIKYIDYHRASIIAYLEVMMEVLASNINIYFSYATQAVLNICNLEHLVCWLIVFTYSSDGDRLWKGGHWKSKTWSSFWSLTLSGLYASLCVYVRGITSENQMDPETTQLPNQTKTVFIWALGK